MTDMPRSCGIASAVVVTGVFAASGTIQARTSRAFSWSTAPPGAAGMRMSQSRVSRSSWRTASPRPDPAIVRRSWARSSGLGSGCPSSAYRPPLTSLTATTPARSVPEPAREPTSPKPWVATRVPRLAPRNPPRARGLPVAMPGRCRSAGCTGPRPGPWPGGSRSRPAPGCCGAGRCHGELRGCVARRAGVPLAVSAGP